MSGRNAREGRKTAREVAVKVAEELGPSLGSIGERLKHLEGWASAFSNMTFKRRLKWVLTGR